MCLLTLFSVIALFALSVNAAITPEVCCIFGSLPDPCGNVVGSEPLGCRSHPSRRTTSAVCKLRYRVSLIEWLV
ncbi:hypothetical protein C8R45DRAFT_979199, partial [Mycena sanguinolenta]